MYQNVGISEGHKRCILSAWEPKGWEQGEWDFFQSACCGSGAVAGCRGMLAALGSGEPAGCHHPTGGDLEHRCSHRGSTAWRRQLWSYSWTARSWRARGQKLSVVVASIVSMVTASFPLCKRGREGFVCLPGMRNSLILLGACLPHELLQRGTCSL